MQVKLYRRQDCLIAKLMGEIDHHSAAKIRDKIDFEVVKSGCKNLILDFSEVGFMDSSGVGVVIGRYKNIKRMNGFMYVSNLSDTVRKMLQMCGVFTLVPELEKADEKILLAGGLL